MVAAFFVFKSGGLFEKLERNLPQKRKGEWNANQNVKDLVILGGKHTVYVVGYSEESDKPSSDMRGSTMLY